MELFVNIRNGLSSLAIFLKSSILDVWLDSLYVCEVCFSHVIFNKIVRLVATCNIPQRCMSCPTFSIDKTLINSIFQIIVPARKNTLKSINGCIRTWFQISPHLTKKAQEWVYSYQTRILLLSLKMFYSLLSCLPH